MYLAEVYIEHPVRAVDQLFTYCAHRLLQKGVRVKVSFGHQTIIGFVYHSYEVDQTKEEYEKENGFAIKDIVEVIDQNSLLTSELFELAEYMKDITISSMISCYQVMLPTVLKPSSVKHTVVLEKWVNVTEKENDLKGKQLEAYQYVLDKKEALYSELRKEYPSQALVLLKKGYLKVFQKERSARKLVSYEKKEKLTLTSDQQKVMNEFLNTDDKVYLLRGVTGAGKTEVYLQLAEKVLNEGKQVLILVPEIALTPQMIERVSSRFGESLAIYHSRLNAQEKYEQYQLVRNHKARVVVGTRSAVFLPFDKLGIIIMDEEHDPSYKQDNQPAYHCRDIAIWRGNYHNCKVLLGSATPALESYARATKNVYHLLTLSERINKTLPTTEIVSMREALKHGQSLILSDTLVEKIQDRLDKNEQVILLLNRRGYSHSLICKNCGESIKCRHCDLTLSYHAQDKTVKCHTCGFSMRVPRACPSCHSTLGFTQTGFGTEKLEEYLKQVFPNVRVLRMDADTTSRKGSHEKILKAFGDHEADVLIGTQMIAKGLDYKDVTLVGILNGDEGLARTDYRSCEVTFDLLMQASGRSGRAENPGEVIIQVFDDQHYAVTCAASQDYLSFYAHEMNYRHAGMYPPYTYFISLTVSSRNDSEAKSLAETLKEHLTGGDFKILGVVSLLKIKDAYRYRIILKGRNLDTMRNTVRTVLEHSKLSTKDIRIDVNPMVLD